MSDKGRKSITMEELSMAATQEAVTVRKFIDIDKIFRQKGGKLYPLIPKFIIRYLKRITHQDQLNDALNRFHDRMGLDFVASILHDFFTVEIKVNNPENIPLSGNYIVASNHPLGGLDGLALMHAIGTRRKDIKFIVNDLLLELKNLSELFVPVNKLGRNSAKSVEIIDNLYKSDDMVLIFPAGLVSRKQKKGIIQDVEWKKSFITKAIKYHRDVIPVFIDGRNSDFFYNIARLRKMLGLKANIEMLYLPDEMFSQVDKKISITFGKPIPYNTFTNKKTHHEWANWVKQEVYRIGDSSGN